MPPSTDVRAEHVPEPLVLALPEEVEVELGGQAGDLRQRRHVGTAATAPGTSRSMPASGIDDQVGPVRQLVAELVDRLVELEGGQQRGATGRVDRHQGVDALLRVVGGEEGLTVALLPGLEEPEQLGVALVPLGQTGGGGVVEATGACRPRRAAATTG